MGNLFEKGRVCLHAMTKYLNRNAEQNRVLLCDDGTAILCFICQNLNIGNNLERSQAVVKVILVSQLIGGSIAGLGGGVELLSPICARFTWASLLGYGWDAIIICTLSRKNPLYTPLAAFFLAYLRTGASIMARSTDVTLEIIQITQGIIILLVVAEQFLSGYRQKIIAKEAKATLKEQEVA